MQISTSMASFCRTMPLEQAVALVKNAGFDGLDFPFSVYGSHAGDPLLRDDWRDWVHTLADVLDRTQLPIVQAHAPWKQAIPVDFHTERPWEVYARCIEACSLLGCRRLVFHPLRQPDRVATPELRARIHAWNVRWFSELCGLAACSGVCICLENTFDSHHVQLPGDPPYPYTRAEELLALMRDIGDDCVGLCLDTGHANIEAQDVPAMIRTLGHALKTVHLNDNYGRIGPIYEDLHLFPGYGSLNWPELLRALREVGFRGAINMEPIAELPKSTPAVRLLQLRAAGAVLREYLAEIAQ